MTDGSFIGIFLRPYSVGILAIAAILLVAVLINARRGDATKTA